MEKHNIERSDKLPFSNIRADKRAKIGKWTVRASFPTAASMGIACAIMENEDILGITPSIFESPQTALLAIPPIAVFAVGKIMQASAEFEIDGQQS